MSGRHWLGNSVAFAVLFVTFCAGCGSAQQEAVYVRHETPLRNTTEAVSSIEVPEATVRAMKACVDEVNPRLAESSQAFQYSLRTNERGNVSGVQLQDSTARDVSLEACFEQALLGMQVPREALRLPSTKPI